MSVTVIVVGVALYGLFNHSTSKSRLECVPIDGSPSRLSSQLEFYRPWVFWANGDGFISVASEDGDHLYFIDVDTHTQIARLRAGPKLLPAGKYSLASQSLSIKVGNERFEADCITL